MFSELKLKINLVNVEFWTTPPGILCRVFVPQRRTPAAFFLLAKRHLRTLEQSEKNAGKGYSAGLPVALRTK